MQVDIIWHSLGTCLQRESPILPETEKDPILNMPQRVEMFSKNDPAVSGEMLTSFRRDMSLNRADYARGVGLLQHSVATGEAATNRHPCSRRFAPPLGQ